MAGSTQEIKTNIVTGETAVEVVKVAPSELRHIVCSKYDLWRFWKVNQNVLMPRYKDLSLSKSSVHRCVRAAMQPVDNDLLYRPLKELEYAQSEDYTHE